MIGVSVTQMNVCCRWQTYIHDNFFSHPDYTVGPGISPDRLLKQFTDYTVGREYASDHAAPCPEEFLFVFTVTILCIYRKAVNHFLYAHVIFSQGTIHTALHIHAFFHRLQSVPFRAKAYSFIVSWILCFLRSTLKTLTSTISPTLTASSGCLI